MSSLAEVVASGSLLLAIPIAVLAGLVSFFSPCCLPLVPGYLSYVTGLSGAELTATTAASSQEADADTDAGGSGGGVAVATTAPSAVRTRSRVAAGSVLFVAGFSAVFVSYGALFGGLGGLLLQYSGPLQRILGVIVILLGLSFAGWLPIAQRDMRVHRAPVIGLAGAPLLGALFALGWTPCIGPTLAAVQTLAFTEASAARGALLAAAYSLGLGVPFIIIGLTLRRAAGALAFFRRHTVAIMRIGGITMIAIGLLLVTGTWDELTIQLRVWSAGFAPAL